MKSMRSKTMARSKIKGGAIKDETIETQNIKNGSLLIEDLSQEIIDLLLPYYKMESNNSLSQTTSTNFQVKSTMVTDTLVAGTYKITWTYEWNAKNKNTDFETEIFLNGSLLQGHREQAVSENYDDEEHTQNYIQSGLNVQVLSGVNTIELRYRTATNKKSISIWNTILDIMRVA
jgi:hypothetical protein